MIIRIRKRSDSSFKQRKMMMNHQKFQPVTSMVDRMTISSNADTSSRCLEIVGAPSVVAEEFIRPESKSPPIVLDPRRFISHHQQFKVFSSYSMLRIVVNIKFLK